jgi:hypothetical protein
MKLKKAETKVSASKANQNVDKKHVIQKRAKYFAYSNHLEKADDSPDVEKKRANSGTCSTAN